MSKSAEPSFGSLNRKTHLFMPDPDAIFKQYPEGLNLEVDLPKLVEFTAVSPLAPGWFLESVADVTMRYGYEWQTKASSLAGKPFI